MAASELEVSMVRNLLETCGDSPAFREYKTANNWANAVASTLFVGAVSLASPLLGFAAGIFGAMECYDRNKKKLFISPETRTEIVPPAIQIEYAAWSLERDWLGSEPSMNRCAGALNGAVRNSIPSLLFRLGAAIVVGTADYVVRNAHRAFHKFFNDPGDETMVGEILADSLSSTTRCLDALRGSFGVRSGNVVKRLASQHVRRSVSAPLSRFAV